MIRDGEPVILDSEIGRILVINSRIAHGTVTIYSARRELLPETAARGHVRSDSFREIEAITAANVPSMRNSAALLNKLLHRDGEADSINHRTLSWQVEQEGSDILNWIEAEASAIMESNGFDPESGAPLDAEEVDGAITHPACAAIANDQVIATACQYNSVREPDRHIDVSEINEEYFPNECYVNVSVDDVGVVAQKESGRAKGSAPKEHRKYVNNTVVHIQQGAGQYILNGLGLQNTLKCLLAFLLSNQLLANRKLVFFVDGDMHLRDKLQNMFSWLPFEIVLDWFHLAKKCKERLSMAMKGKEMRNAALKQLLVLLWLGKTDMAINYLKCLDPASIKNSAHIVKLIEYLKRNMAIIPNYALRKEIGLRNSSNRGEKANDLVVAGRQKHQGMSWSRKGSSGMAAICSLIRNSEFENWNRKHRLSFALKYPEVSDDMQLVA